MTVYTTSDPDSSDVYVNKSSKKRCRDSIRRKNTKETGYVYKQWTALVWILERDSERKREGHWGTTEVRGGKALVTLS